MSTKQVELIPTDWRWSQLKYACSRVTDGSHYSPKPQPTGRLIANVKDMRDNYLDLERCTKISEQDFLALRRNGCAPQPGDILLSKDGTIGKVIVFQQNEALVVLSSIAILRPTPAVDSRFLGQALRSFLFSRQVEALTSGSALRRLVLRDIASLYVPIPPLVEQRRIAKILDTVDAAIQQTEALIAKLKLMKVGLLHDLLTRGLDEHGQLRDPVAHPEQFKDSPLGHIPTTWAVVRLRDLYSISARNGLYKHASHYGKGSLMIHMPQMFRGLTIDVSDAARVDVTPVELERFGLQANDLVFARRSLNLEGAGRCSLVPQLPEPTTFESSIIRVRLQAHKLRPVFANYFLNSEAGFRLRLPLIRQVAVSGVSSADIASLLMPHPPIEEQDAIIHILDVYDGRIRAEEAYRDKLKLLKKGLMDDLLTGRVRVNALEDVAV